jgi:pimeloyl-ACP methyl ester carboxylesterase
MPAMATLKRARTSVLDVGYEEHGPADGAAVMLMHGWPYDPRTYDEVAPQLAAAGCRAIVPYLRGFGPTRFLSPSVPRSGQQAALGLDLKELMDALAIERAILAGYDWGGRAACIVAALWPDRARGLLTGNGYNIQDIAASVEPTPPEHEHRIWYQYYLHTERGRAGLQKNRREFIRLLWRLWSPNWKFDDATFERSAPSFDNPDFVDVTVQSYRHRFGYAPGDPELDEIERRLVGTPRIAVPTVVLHGGGAGVIPAGASATHARYFTGPYERHVIAMVGHNLPQEAPVAFADAVLKLVRATS